MFVYEIAIAIKVKNYHFAHLEHGHFKVKQNNGQLNRSAEYDCQQKMCDFICGATLKSDPFFTLKMGAWKNIIFTFTFNISFIIWF